MENRIATVFRELSYLYGAKFKVIRRDQPAIHPEEFPLIGQRYGAAVQVPVKALFYTVFLHGVKKFRNDLLPENGRIMQE